METKHHLVALNLRASRSISAEANILFINKKNIASSRLEKWHLAEFQEIHQKKLRYCILGTHPAALTKEVFEQVLYLDLLKKPRKKKNFRKAETKKPVYFLSNVPSFPTFSGFLPQCRALRCQLPDPLAEIRFVSWRLKQELWIMILWGRKRVTPKNHWPTENRSKPMVPSCFLFDPQQYE